MPKTRLVEERKNRQWSQQEVADRVNTTQHNISRWERGVTAPGPYFRSKLCELFDKSPEELGFILEYQPASVQEYEKTNSNILSEEISHAANFPGIWSVPYPRNPFFTGRAELLQQLHTQFNKETLMALTQPRSISGLGGIGKTQVALEYAYQYHQNYRYVFWINAATHEALLASMVTIAELLQLPEKDEYNCNRTILAVKQWLTTHKQWLLILDNADDLSVVYEVIPGKLSEGHVLLTTRAQALGTLAERVEIGKMGMAESILFLLRRAKVLALDVTLDGVPEEHLTPAEAIVIEMDFLSLALDQVGAYIEEIGCNLADYLELYRTHRTDLLRRRGHIATSHPESVTTTWSLNFQRVEQANPVAAELLRLCAFLEPDTIPEELFSRESTFSGVNFPPVTRDAFVLNEAIEELRKLSLIQRQPETQTLQIHRLVQVVLRDALTQDTQRRLAQYIVQLINTLFPTKIEVATWAQCQRYLPQAQVCATLIADYSLSDVETVSLLNRTATYLQVHTFYEQAWSLYQQAIHIAEHILKHDHPQRAYSLQGLASLLYEQGK